MGDWYIVRGYRDDGWMRGDVKVLAFGDDEDDAKRRVKKLFDNPDDYFEPKSARPLRREKFYSVNMIDERTV